MTSSYLDIFTWLYLSTFILYLLSIISTISWHVYKVIYIERYIPDLYIYYIDYIVQSSYLMYTLFLLYLPCSRYSTVHILSFLYKDIYMYQIDISVVYSIHIQIVVYIHLYLFIITILSIYSNIYSLYI